MPDEASALGDGVAGTLGRLAAHMRAAGAHVGMGELLAAHRALAAVDASSREDAYLALRAAMCSSRADLAVFAAAFEAVFAAPAVELPNPLEALGEGAQMALPRISVPDDRPRPMNSDRPVSYDAAPTVPDRPEAVIRCIIHGGRSPPDRGRRVQRIACRGRKICVCTNRLLNAG